ncbi:MAG: phosphoribosylglycinamide formyltransferase, partial [Actinobacteria bacterium]|nr:phosphoribosylglycinamide formyltransferase [Actinomycetota bacterium]
GLVVSAGLMRILPAGFVREFSPRLINTHPALLPLYPGAHAVRDAHAAGAVETGVTVHVIDEGVDTAPVLRQQGVAILPGETEDQLHERIKQVERPLLVEPVRAIAAGELKLPG